MIEKSIQMITSRVKASRGLVHSSMSVAGLCVVAWLGAGLWGCGGAQKTSAFAKISETKELAVLLPASSDVAFRVDMKGLRSSPHFPLIRRLTIGSAGGDGKPSPIWSEKTDELLGAVVFGQEGKQVSSETLVVRGRLTLDDIRVWLDSLVAQGKDKNSDPEKQSTFEGHLVLHRAGRDALQLSENLWVVLRGETLSTLRERFESGPKNSFTASALFAAMVNRCGFHKAMSSIGSKGGQGARGSVSGLGPLMIPGTGDAKMMCAELSVTKSLEATARSVFEKKEEAEVAAQGLSVKLNEYKRNLAVVLLGFNQIFERVTMRVDHDKELVVSLKLSEVETRDTMRKVDQLSALFMAQRKP